MKLWVCAVRQEAFVGGESQRCRHSTVGVPGPGGFAPPECGEMELIGGEPVEWCVVHEAVATRFRPTLCYLIGDKTDDEGRVVACRFESQRRVGP